MPTQVACETAQPRSVSPTRSKILSTGTGGMATVVGAEPKSASDDEEKGFMIETKEDCRSCRSGAFGRRSVPEVKRRSSKALSFQEAEKRFNDGCSFYHGWDFKKVDKERGEALIIEAMRRGSLAAKGKCFELGIGGLKRDVMKAVRCYSKSAEKGNSVSQNSLGLLLLSGQGFQANVTAAVKWFILSAKNGQTDAFNNLGKCLCKGNGIKKNLKQGLMYYRLSAGQGNSNGQISLGDCYLTGCGVNMNLTEAIKWYRKSAAQQNKSAKERLLKVQPPSFCCNLCLLHK